MCWDPVVISIPINDELGATVVSWWFFWLEEENMTKLTQKDTRLPHPWLSFPPFYWKHKKLLYFTFNHICQAGSTTLILCIHSPCHILCCCRSLRQGQRPLHPCLLKTGQGSSRQKLDLHIHSKGSFGSPPPHHTPCCALKSFHFYWSQRHQRGPKGRQAHTSPFYLKSLQLLPVGPKIVDEGVKEVEDRIVGCFLSSPHITTYYILHHVARAWNSFGEISKVAPLKSVSDFSF